MVKAGFKKLDNWLFGFATKVTLWYVRKHKYKLHKYDFFIVVTGWECAWWVSQIIWQFTHDKEIGFGVFMFVAVLLLEVMKIFSLKLIKQSYDILWELRKDPMVYKVLKEVCEEKFKKGYKQRKVIVIMDIFFLIALSFLLPLLAPVYLFILFSAYETYIFDMEEPPRKEKEVKDSITDIAMKAFKDLTAPLKPQEVKITNYATLCHQRKSSRHPAS
jgi:hypothetical protein